MDVDAAGSPWVHPGQLLVQALEALGGGPKAELRPDRRVCTGAVKEPVEKGLDVQGRPPHGHYGPALEPDLLDERDGLVQKQPHAGGLAGFQDVDHVVLDLLAAVGRGLGRADVHAAVDLHGVDADDLAFEAPGQLKRQCALARGRDTQDQNLAGLHTRTSAIIQDR